MEQRGAKAYAEAAKGRKHIAAIEADRGGFTPWDSQSMLPVNK